MDRLVAEVVEVCEKLGVSIDTSEPKVSCAAKNAWSRSSFYA